MAAVHPAAATWALPGPDRPAPPDGTHRTNLRMLAARPLRFEHHLIVVGSVGVAQLEIATASEPLYFAHANISDEYAIALHTGDAMIDGFPLRTFLTNPATLEDVGRLNHRTGDLVLHPHGLLHWPGRLRAPYAPFAFGPGMRRTGVTLVYCASRPTPPGDRPLRVSAGREADAKAYGGGGVPFLLADMQRDPPGPVGAIGDTRMELLVRPETIAPPRGGLLVVLAAAPGSAHFAADLLHLRPGGRIAGAGIERALLISSETASPEPPPPSWNAVAEPPFPVFEDAPAGALPISAGGLTVEEESPSTVRVRIDGKEGSGIPRYWLARLLFRLALHGPGLGYVETYEGFFYEGGERVRLGVRGVGSVSLPPDEVEPVLERLYRAVAPAGYVERL